MTLQLEFCFEETRELDLIKNDVKNAKLSNEKVRKSLFARHGELAKKYDELNNRLQILERNICQGAISNL